MSEDLAVSSIRGKVAVVTGAARGIGLGIAEVLAARGVSVGILDISPEGSAAAQSLTLHGGNAIAIPTDVRDRASVEAAVEHVISTFGRLDMAVNNAGVSILTSFLELDDEAWQETMSLNLTAMFMTSQVCAQRMISERWLGSIVNISSIAAFGYTAQHPAYAATKAGVVALTRDMAYELGPAGLRANAVAPGPTITPMTKGHDWGTHFDRALRLGRWGAASDIGRAVAFLASDEASFITGQTLCVAGGADLRTLDPGL